MCEPTKKCSCVALLNCVITQFTLNDKHVNKTSEESMETNVRVISPGLGISNDNIVRYCDTMKAFCYAYAVFEKKKERKNDET